MKIERNINVSFKFYVYDSDENMIFQVFFYVWIYKVGDFFRRKFKFIIFIQ